VARVTFKLGVAQHGLNIGAKGGWNQPPAAARHSANLQQARA
jgi:hypothetical protein